MHVSALGFAFYTCLCNRYAFLCIFMQSSAPFLPGVHHFSPGKIAGGPWTTTPMVVSRPKNMFPQPKNTPFLLGEHVFSRGKKPLRERCLGRTEVSCVCRQDICCVCRQDICCVSRQDICCVSPRHPFLIAHTRAAAKRPPLCSQCLRDVLGCLLYTSPSPRDRTRSRMPSSA